MCSLENVKVRVQREEDRSNVPLETDFKKQRESLSVCKLQVNLKLEQKDWVNSPCSLVRTDVSVFTACAELPLTQTDLEFHLFCLFFYIMWRHKANLHKLFWKEN